MVESSIENRIDQNYTPGSILIPKKLTDITARREMKDETYTPGSILIPKKVR